MEWNNVYDVFEQQVKKMEERTSISLYHTEIRTKIRCNLDYLDFRKESKKCCVLQQNEVYKPIFDIIRISLPTTIDVMYTRCLPLDILTRYPNLDRDIYGNRKRVNVSKSWNQILTCVLFEILRQQNLISLPLDSILEHYYPEEILTTKIQYSKI